MQENMQSDMVWSRILEVDWSWLIQRTDKKRLENMNKTQKSIDASPPSYMDSLNEATTDRKVEFISSKIKSSVRQNMEGM